LSQQGSEPGLLEVVVAGEGLGQAAFGHDNERTLRRLARFLVSANLPETKDLA
jgi:hypothetical protein